MYFYGMGDKINDNRQEDEDEGEEDDNISALECIGLAFGRGMHMFGRGSIDADTINCMGRNSAACRSHGMLQLLHSTRTPRATLDGFWNGDGFRRLDHCVRAY